MTDPAFDLPALRAALVARLRELSGASESTAESRRAVTLDQSSVGRLSRADALQVQAMALATEDRRRAEARRIEAAIRRIDEGEYGDCVSCGEPIAPQRLAADPVTPTCIDCASGAER